MARRLAAALGLLLLVTSCSSSAEDEVRTGSPTTLRTDGSPSDTTGADGSGPGSGSSGGATASTRRPSGSGSGATSGGQSGSSRSTKDDIDAAAASAVGRFAGVLLARGPATSIVLDVRVGDGADPIREPLDNAARILSTYSGKPVSINGPTPLRGVGRGPHTADEIRRLASSQGSPNRDGVAVVHVLYLAGSFEEANALGVAVRGDTVALFTDAMDGATSPFVSRSRLEHAVVTHELGHVLGLVDLFFNADRDDPEHPGHSRNRGSVMFWAVETSLVGQVLGGPPPVDFDAADIADLQRIRAG